MNVQFGIWHFDGRPAEGELLAKVSALLEPFGAVETRVTRNRSLATVTAGTRSRCQPPELAPRILWNGRLDNREELAAQTGTVSNAFSDEEIVSAAYRRRGTDSFAQIVGDWAISIADEEKCELVLARDFVGTRPLFYKLKDRCVTWSTILEPLVLLSEHEPDLSEEYLAEWLAFFPQSHLTPYRDISSVPPGSFVRIAPGGASVRNYCSLESVRAVRYRDDREYEEHFRSVFRASVRRRVNTEDPILGELSGGMDSSSIICIADSVLGAGAPRLDTVTYFDAQEPNWDELPFARLVEQKRGRVGHHIDVGTSQNLADQAIPPRFSALPTSASARSSSARVFDQIVSDHGYRVILSGLGGDEMLGGVPTPVPELADLLVRLKALRFLRQSFRWAFAKRKPIVRLWLSVLASFFAPRTIDSSANPAAWNWLTPEFRMRNREHLGAPARPLRFFGPLPSLQANSAAVEALGRQISCVSVPRGPVYEWRYPFLDRDLVAFCSSIPREQLVRPKERRSLMRRALAGIVPREILERKRKAYVSRGLVKALAGEWRMLREAPFRSEDLRVVDSALLRTLVAQAEQGKDVPVVPLLRTLALERWLRELDAADDQPSDSPLLGLPAHPAPREFLGRETP
jgi:asparagine synthase (glutamine-hydrolysing)